MKRMHLCFLACLFSCYYETNSQTSRSTTVIKQDIIDDVQDRGGRTFVKTDFKKHPLPGLGETTNTNGTQSSPPNPVVVIKGKSRDRIPFQSHSRSDSLSPSCSPRRYRVRIGYGNCSRAVVTKVCQMTLLHSLPTAGSAMLNLFLQMCYGECTSHTFLKQVDLTKDDVARHGFDSLCKCCSATRISTRRHDVRCSNGSSKSKKTFYVPFAEGCFCRPCTR